MQIFKEKNQINSDIDDMLGSINPMQITIHSRDGPSVRIAMTQSTLEVNTSDC